MMGGIWILTALLHFLSLEFCKIWGHYLTGNPGLDPGVTHTPFRPKFYMNTPPPLNLPLSLFQIHGSSGWGSVRGRGMGECERGGGGGGGGERGS